MLGTLMLHKADMVLVLVLGLFAVWGWKKGLLKMGFGLLSFVAAILLGRLLYPYCAEFLRHTVVYEKLFGMAQQQMLSGNTEATQGIIGDVIAKSEAAVSGVVANYLAELALNVIAFLLMVVLVKLILMLVSRLLRGIASLPILGQVNRLAGLALGILEGVLVVTVVLAGIYVAAPLRENPTLSREIEASVVVREWYLQNPLVTWTLPDTNLQVEE